MDILNATNLTFNPGIGPYTRHPRVVRLNRPRTSRTSQTRPFQAKQPPKPEFHFPNTNPNLLAIVPDVPFSYSVAQAKCGISLQKRNT
jgi:hypothetical protein